MESKKSYYIALSASIINSYDYALFGFMAARLSKEFFPGSADIDQLLNFFLMFSITIVVRPFASIFFGFIGDKYGRAKVLRSASYGIAIPALAIGFIPSYNYIGYIATILFILARILIITFLAGEVDGIRIYIYEKISPKRKFFGSGLVTACNQAGSLIAALACWFAGLNFVPDFMWRLNFIVGGICGVVIIILRSALQESNQFNTYKKSKDYDLESNKRLIDLIRENFRKFVRSTLIQGSIGGIYHFHIIFYGVYAHKILGISNSSHVGFIITCTICAYVISALVSGILHDKYNSQKIATFALSSTFILGAVNIYNIQYSIYSDAISIIIGTLTPMHTTALFIYLKQQFKTGVTYRLFTFSHALGSLLISSTTPFVAIKLWDKYHISWLPLVYFLLLVSILLYYLQNKDFTLQD